MNNNSESSWQSRLECLPCVDSDELAAKCRLELDIPRERAAELGRTAVEWSEAGFYINGKGERIDSRDWVERALAQRVSIPPDAQLPEPPAPRFDRTRVRVINTTTLRAAKEFAEQGSRALALNFADGVSPGGGFLDGLLTQEEVLCRSSALYLTLRGDPMYAFHAKRPLPDSTD